MKNTKKGLQMNELQTLTNKELEQKIYEAINEMTNSKYYKKLLAERKRRNLEE